MRELCRRILRDEETFAAIRVRDPEEGGRPSYTSRAGGTDRDGDNRPREGAGGSGADRRALPLRRSSGVADSTSNPRSEMSRSSGPEGRSTAWGAWTGRNVDQVGHRARRRIIRSYETRLSSAGSAFCDCGALLRVSTDGHGRLREDPHQCRPLTQSHSLRRPRSLPEIPPVLVAERGGTRSAVADHRRSKARIVRPRAVPTERSPDEGAGPSRTG